MSVVGCKTPSIGARTDVAWVEEGESAPFSGFLLTKRMLIVLYEDAEKESTEETLQHLHELYSE